MKKINKIVLIQPNLKWCEWNFKTFWEIVPYNLCLLTAEIENEYDVEIIDANIDNMSYTEFTDKITGLKPHLVGITMMTLEYAEAAHMTAKLVKDISSDIITVLGGVYATTSTKNAMQDKNIDYVVIGEGEYVFHEFLNYLNGLCPFPKEGVAYKKDGKSFFLQRAAFIKDLDSLPLPAYHKIDYPRYLNHIERASVDAPREIPYTSIRTSRGCPIGCVFCQVENISGKIPRYRSAENVIKELLWQKKEYGIKSVIFNDDNLIMNKTRAKQLFKAMIENTLDLTWNAVGISVFRLDEETVDLMKESGCKFIDLAIESGVDRVLKEIINKPVNLRHAVKMIKYIKNLGDIDLASNFIIGFPGETWDEIRQTIKFAEEIDVDYIKIFIATPLANTELYDMVMQNNLAIGKNIETDLNWSESKIFSDEFTPKDLAILRAYEWDRINFSNPRKMTKIAKMMRITEEELNQIRKKTRKSVKA